MLKTNRFGFCALFKFSWIAVLCLPFVTPSAVAPHFVVSKQQRSDSDRFWVVHQDKNEKSNFLKKSRPDFNTDYRKANEENDEIEELTDDYYEDKDIIPETDNFGLKFGALLKPINLIKPLKPFKPIKQILSTLPTLPTLPTFPTFPTLPTLATTKRTKVKWTKLKRTKTKRTKIRGLIGAVVRAKLVKTVQTLLSELQVIIANC